MARGTGTNTAPTASRSTADESSPPAADDLVVFGITDLAKVMTFHSLYRLEARRLPPVHSYERGFWGPHAAEKLVAGHGRWHGPWLAR